MAAELQNDGSTVTIDLVAEFRRLAAKWHQEAGYLSSLTEAFERPAYREIIALGPDVVPIILRELEIRPVWWFGALRELTGENPVHPEHRGRLDLISKDWIEWGYGKGYLAK